MNAPVAQIVALTVFGNAALAGREVGEFFPGNSTGQFCQNISFVRKPRFPIGFRERMVAAVPESWFGLLCRESARGLYLSWFPDKIKIMGLSDRRSAGLIGGGGKWRMTAVYPRRAAENWAPIWEVGNVAAPEKRIWKVRYQAGKGGRTFAPPENDLAQLRHTLAESLAEIKAFAAEQELNYYSVQFDQALTAVEGKGEGFLGYHGDLAPPDFLSGPAVTLLDAAQIAWVFGGMGSWNDLAFKGADQERYETLSEQLFQAVIGAIVGATNSTYPAS